MDYTGYIDRQAAQAEAIRRQQELGACCYFGKAVPGVLDGGDWYVTDRMPTLGEWYDSNGIRHG